MDVIIIMIGCVLAFVTVAAGLCAGISPMKFLRKTFVPLTKREFWLPPCPFCWAARAAAATLMVAVAVHTL